MIEIEATNIIAWSENLTWVPFRSSGIDDHISSILKYCWQYTKCSNDVSLRLLFNTRGGRNDCRLFYYSVFTNSMFIFFISVIVVLHSASELVGTILVVVQHVSELFVDCFGCVYIMLRSFEIIFGLVRLELSFISVTAH